MRRIVLALVALPQWGGWLAQTHAAPATQQGSADKENPHIANKSLEFVNIIKDDLRRNNDDYVMPDPRSQVYPTPPELPAPPELSAHPAALPPYRNLILPPEHQPALLMKTSFGQPEPLPKQPSQPVPLPMQPSQSEPLTKQPSWPVPLPMQPSQSEPLLKQPSQPILPSMQPNQSEPLPVQPSQHRPPSQSGSLPKQPSQPGPPPMQPSQPGPPPMQPSQPRPPPMQPSQPGPLFNQPGPLLNQPEQIRRHLEQLPYELNIEPRRSLNMAMTETSSAYNPFIFKSYTRSTRSPRPPRSPRTPRTPRSTRSTHSARYKHLRINKLKRLIDKKKHWTRMAQQFETGGTTSSSPATMNPTPQSAAPPPPARPPAPPLVTNTSPTAAPRAAASPARSPARTPAQRPHYRPPDERQQQPVMRQKPELGSSPSPDQLDMAPARGAQIRDIRFKGRLCQRNLMNMEGPSYDKAGNEVNPPHHPSNSRGRRFYQTRAPKLVLPRCCNCCKKSVLGCQ